MHVHDSYKDMSNNSFVLIHITSKCQLMTWMSAHDSSTDMPNNAIGGCSQFIHRSVNNDIGACSQFIHGSVK